MDFRINQTESNVHKNYTKASEELWDSLDRWTATQENYEMKS